MTKEKKPTQTELKIQMAQDWLGNLYVPTFGYAGQAEFCYNLQQKFKLSRAQIALVTDLTLRQVQTRLKQYRKFVAAGEVPSAEFAETGLSTDPNPIEAIIDEELEKEQQTIAAKESTLLVGRLLIEDRIAEKLAHIVPTKQDLSAVEKLWRSAKTKPKNRRAEDAVAIKSDWHLGLENPQYGYETAIEVNDRFVKKVIRLTDLHRTQCEVRRLFYVLNGDNIQGSSANFPSQRWTVRMTGADQVEGYVGTEIRNIETFLVDYDEVVVVCEDGNHGNIYPKKTSVEPDHANFERMAHRALRWAFRGNSRVKFLFSDTWYQVVTVQDFKLLATHGHHISGAGSLDGIRASFRKLEGILPYFDAFTVGHFHQHARLTMPQAFGSHTPRTGYLNGTAILGDTHSERFGSAHSNIWWNLFVYKNQVTAEYPVHLYLD